MSTVPGTIVLDGDALRGHVLTSSHKPEAATLAAYARATGDHDPARLEGSAGSCAYAFVPFSQALFGAFGDLLGPDAAGRVIHQSQSFTCLAPIVAGRTLSVTSTLTGLSDGPFGAVLEFTGLLEESDGTPVNRQVTRLIVLEAQCVNPIGTGPEPPAVAAGTTRGQLTLTMAADQPLLYSVPSGDTMPVHMDPAAARRAGFPSVIVQGMCTLAMTCNALEREHGGGARTVSALELEFVRPVFPSDRLAVRWQALPSAPLSSALPSPDVTSSDDCAVYGFDVVNRRQRPVIRAGRIVLSGS